MWRWALPHPQWEPPEQEGSPADWPAMLDLPVEMVLVSHREPVLRDGHAALERALA